MSEEDFLRRWFRRKREAGAAHDQPVESEAPMQAGPLSYDEGDVAAEPKIDLSALPPIDSITCASDITPFLRKGIPEELTRAALRRAWSTDPAIRDFIGLAENAWDFNDPDAMPGFGPLDWSAEQIQTLVGRVVGSARSIAENCADAAEPGIDRQSDNSERKLASQAVSELDPLGETSLSEPQQRPAAAQPEAPRNVASDEVTMVRRTHGSALPR